MDLSQGKWRHCRPRTRALWLRPLFCCVDRCCLCLSIWNATKSVSPMEKKSALQLGPEWFMPSYAEQYRDRWASGPIAFWGWRTAEGDENVKISCISSTLLHHHARRITNAGEMGWKCFRERAKRCHWGRSGMHGEISPGLRSIEGEEQYRGEAITSRAKPSPCSLPAPLFSPSLHPSFNLDSSLVPSTCSRSHLPWTCI